jgi:hypothetical protein
MPRKASLAIGAVVVGIIVVGGAAAAAGEGGERGASHRLNARARKRCRSRGGLGRQGRRSEIGDDGVAYEVEVVREDGSVVGVSLDESFTVIGSERDDDVDAAAADDD